MNEVMVTPPLRRLHEDMDMNRLGLLFILWNVDKIHMLLKMISLLFLKYIIH